MDEITLTPEERFDIALSLQLGIPMSRLKDELTAREYEAYQKYFMLYGIGQEADYLRSANQILTIMNYITGAVGGKPQKLTPEDIYPQLSYSKKKKRHGNNAVNWDTTPPHIREQLIAQGLFTEEGDPKGYNPHSR